MRAPAPSKYRTRRTELHRTERHPTSRLDGTSSCPSPVSSVSRLRRHERLRERGMKRMASPESAMKGSPWTLSFVSCRTGKSPLLWMSDSMPFPASGDSPRLLCLSGLKPMGLRICTCQRSEIPEITAEAMARVMDTRLTLPVESFESGLVVMRRAWQWIRSWKSPSANGSPFSASNQMSVIVTGNKLSRLLSNGWARS